MSWPRPVHHPGLTSLMEWSPVNALLLSFAVIFVAGPQHNTLRNIHFKIGG